MWLSLLFPLIFSLQTLDFNDGFYVIFESESENMTFSSYRLGNPDRIVFEANGVVSGDDAISGGTIKSVEKSVNGSMTRYVFFIEPGSQYTVFNRKGTVIIGFSRSIFLDDTNFDTITAELNRRNDSERLAEANKLEEEKRIAEAEKQKGAEAKGSEDETLLVDGLLNELKEEEQRLAEEKRIAEAKKLEEEQRLAEEKRIAEAKKLEEEQRLAEEKRIAEAKKLEEEQRLAEEKRIAEAKKLEEEQRLAEEKRIAEAKKLEEEQRLAEKKRMAEAKKLEEEKSAPVAKRSVKSEDGEIRHLKVTKAEKEPGLSESLPNLPVNKLTRKGNLKNIFFRKFPEFSRVTMEVDGETDYQFREITGGFVIDVYNFAKIPNYLLNIIDTRAFKAEVLYIYPKKEGDILKIYIKTDPGMAVRKSEEGKYINFDFFKPTLE